MIQANDLKELKIIYLSKNNFHENSLDNFASEQCVTECWRKTDGEYKLIPVTYTEEWSLSVRREMALKILSATEDGAVAVAAELCGTIIGFALLSGNIFGGKNAYVDLAEFYVAAPYRRRGIGKILFKKICAEAKKRGAKKLYISAHSAKESIAAYKKYGCVPAAEPDGAHVVKEPFDLQLEYDLSPRIYEVEDKEEYMQLLLLADEQREMVERYLSCGVMFVIDDCGVKGEIVVSDIGDGILEIKNLAVLPEFRCRGYGRMLIDYICKRYKGDYAVVYAGTGDSPLTVPFYEKCGFERSHTVKNFFTDNYDHPIFECGVLLRDMVYFKKTL